MKVPILSEGEVNQIVTIVKDITEQKESEQKYRMFFDSTPFSVGSVDMIGMIIVVNHNYEIGAVYGKEDLIGKPV